MELQSGEFQLGLATIHALLGQQNEAIEQLEVYLSNPGFYGAGHIERHPVFEPLADNPAFLQMLNRHRVSNS